MKMFRMFAIDDLDGMTVGELRDHLKDFSDDIKIEISSPSYHTMYFNLKYNDERNN